MLVTCASTVRKVMDGTLDMGNVPSRAWDVEGVTSLRALNAPFLITSDALLDEVVASDLAGEMMGGLDDVGVVGLALLPESPRHPFGFAAPLLGPDDYVDGTVRAPLSATTELMFSALGGSRTGAERDFDTQIGMESAYHFDVEGPATGNVTFYPKTNVLAINADAYGGLTDDQRSILERAAGETLDWAIENRPDDLEAAAGFCDEGGTIVLASDADLAALEQAVQPVYDELEADPQTEAHLEAIRQLKLAAAEPSAAPEPCGTDFVAGSGEQPSGTSAENSAINGVYRWELSEEAMRAAGIPEWQIESNAGVWTNTFKNGEWSDDDGWMGAYELDVNAITITHKDGVVETYRWRLTESGDLDLYEITHLSDEQWRDFNVYWISQLWIRVDDTD